MQRFARAGSVTLLSLFLAASALADALHVANWNLGNQPNNSVQQANLVAVLEHVGSTIGALDLMALAETDTASSLDTRAAFETAFGASYGLFTTAADGGGDRTGFIYNTDSLSLVSTTTVTGLTHPALRGQFRPVGTAGEADFWVYAVHLKSGDTSDDRLERMTEAQDLRADADALGEGAVVLYLGDFNWSGADERAPDPTVSAWDVFAAAGNAQAFDPAGSVGDWRDNPLFLSLHTQDPGAAMDDRFDMQLASGELFDLEGLEYIDDSYRVIGNNGTHALNGPITAGSGAPADVLAALATFDHLPVVASYELIPEPAGAGLAIAVAGALLLHRSRVER